MNYFLAYPLPVFRSITYLIVPDSTSLRLLITWAGIADMVLTAVLGRQVCVPGGISLRYIIDRTFRPTHSTIHTDHRLTPIQVLLTARESWIIPMLPLGLKYPMRMC